MSPKGSISARASARERREQAVAGEGLVGLGQFIRHDRAICAKAPFRSSVIVTRSGHNASRDELAPSAVIGFDRAAPADEQAIGDQAQRARRRPGFGARRSNRRRRGRCRDIRRGRRRLAASPFTISLDAAVFEAHRGAVGGLDLDGPFLALAAAPVEAGVSAGRRPPGWRSRYRPRSASARCRGR